MTDTQQLRNDAKKALRRLASSVSVVTCRQGGRDFAMTATAVSALSMEPPSMLVCVNRSATFHAALSQADAFAINVLSRAHVIISRAVQRRGERRKPVRRRQLGYGRSRAGFGRRPGCHHLPERHAELEYGTHTVFMGPILSISTNGEVDPLIYVDGQYTGRAA